MPDLLIGIDIGGTKCAIILGRTEGDKLNIIDKLGFPTETSLGPDHTLNNIFMNIDKVIDRQKLTPSMIEATGVSCGGPLDSKTGVVMSPPNLPGWDNIPLVRLLTERYGIKTGIQNDANACALAEWKFGAGKGTENMVFMTFGTGLGAGLIINGRLYAGHIRLSGFGPVGYGKAGSWEGFCSGGGIAQLARTMIMEKFQMGESVSFCKSAEDLNNISAQVVAEAAMNGDELAIQIYRVSGQYLGKGLSVLIDILNPEMIVIGSIFARSKQLLEPYAMEVIRKEALFHSAKVCRIVPAQLGEDLGDYAALSVASNLLQK